MQWEAIAINADFWSQVLQSQSLKPLDFALGAAMTTTRSRIDGIGGFQALVDFLADDYQLGNMIAARGGRIVLSPVVVECWEPPKNWSEVWRHQLRWARTIRVCQPLPYFFSALGNATLWPLLWWIVQIVSTGVHFTGSWQGTTGYTTTVLPLPGCTWIVATCLLARILTAMKNQHKLTQSRAHAHNFWLAPVKDLLNALIWALAFLGNTVEWRGRRYQVRHGGRLASVP
jgi:ceramide glucosyltransferase